MTDDEVPTLIQCGNDTDEREYLPRLTIITGFLGAGKSTLLRRILTDSHGYRIAVVMNEFADTADIEAKAIKISSAGDPLIQDSVQILELANGCLCCSIKNSGVAAIEQLLQRKGVFDHVLLETSGLADPGPIASMFWQNEEFASGMGKDIVLDGVICVVDAVFGNRQMEEDHSADGIGESLRQIACADIVLLNKVDLVSEMEALSVEERIRKVNPVAPLHRTIKGQIDLKFILGIGAYRSPPQFPDRPAVSLHQHEHDEGQHEGPKFANTNPHKIHAISSLLLSCPTLNSAGLERFDEWIRTVLWENRLPCATESKELHVLRCKGYLKMQSGTEYMLQGVRSMYELCEVGTQDKVGNSGAGKLVLIGKGLDDAVRQSFENIL